MQAGGDVLGRCLTAKHVALEHLGQLITSYVGKVPVGGGASQCLPAPSSAESSSPHHPYTPPPPHPSRLLKGFSPQMVSCGCSLLAGGQTGMHAEVRKNR